MAPPRDGTEGYQFTLEPNWPGLDAEGGRTDIDRSAVRKIAKDLENGLHGLDGIAQDLQGRGAVTAKQLGNWDAGQALARTSAQANSQITMVLQELLGELRGVLDGLLDVAKTSGDAEENSAAALQNLPTQSTVRSAG